MNKTPYEPILISLSDLFGFVIRKTVIIILICIIGTMAGVGFHFLASNTAGAREKYEELLANYNDSVLATENNIRVFESMQLSYLEMKSNNPLFDLYESSKVFVSTMSFSTNSSEALIVDDKTIIYPKSEELLSYYDSINLDKLLSANTKSDYLRSIILLKTNGNIITITAYNHDGDIAKAWVEKVYQELSRYASENQGLNVNEFEITTELYYGQYINNSVKEINDSLFEVNKNILAETQKLKELNSLRPKQFQFVKYAVIGFVFGGFIGLFVMIFAFIRLNPVTNSFVSEKKIGKPFLGALFLCDNLFEKISRAIIGERKYSSTTEAADYIKCNTRNTSLTDVSGKSVAILCSCKSKDVDRQVKTLASILSEFGCKTTLVPDVSVNPESTDVVSSTDAVILLERQWISQWKLVGVSMDLAERFGKPVVGFVLC